MLKLIIADDEAPARNRLRELLSDIDGVNVMAEAKNGQEALSLANDHQPDIITVSYTHLPQGLRN